jgi:hypothetical protein
VAESRFATPGAMYMAPKVWYVTDHRPLLWHIVTELTQPDEPVATSAETVCGVTAQHSPEFPDAEDAGTWPTVDEGPRNIMRGPFCQECTEGLSR